MWDGSQSSDHQSTTPSPSTPTSPSSAMSSSSVTSRAASTGPRAPTATPSNAGGGQQISDKTKDAVPYSGYGKPGKSTSSRNRTRGGNVVSGGSGPAGGQSHYQPHPDGTRSKNTNHQKRPAAARSHYEPPYHAYDVAEADEFEVGSVFKAGSKKQSANHLLNFYTERRGVGQGGGGARNKRAAGYSKNSFTGHKYIKEQYLQANCQFSVKSGADYTIHLNDPDTLVNWDLVEQVGLKTSHVPSCPICLYPPTAAKIARCGHVFCWSCILHYLALSDDTSRKCPICYAQICKTDLKSVVSLTHADIHVGDEIEMSLMRRERNSLFAVPVGQYYPDIDGKHPSINNSNNSYSQLVLASSGEVAKHILAREKGELEAQYREEKDQPEVCFIEEALQYLAQREQESVMVSQLESVEVVTTSGFLGVEELSPSSPDESLVKEVPCVEGGGADVLDDDMRPRHVSTNSDGASSVEITDDMASRALTAEDLDISAVGRVTTSSPTSATGQPVPKDTFFFYQSSDGQAIFLHALNVQMLVTQYGNFENCPKIIRGKILEKEGAIMTEDLRNKLRYLRHLPVTCNFEVCEIILDDAVVGKETEALFKEQLDVRHNRRRRRARDEKRREKRILVEENKLMGKFPDTKHRIESEFHFPEVGSNMSLGLVSAAAAALYNSRESLDSTLSTSPMPTMSGEAGGLSFARMLRKSSAGIASVRRNESNTLAFALPVRVRRDTGDSEPDPEGYVPPPPQSSLGDALALALDRAQICTESGGGKGKKGKKGKRMKGIVLGGAPRPNV